MTDVVFQSSRTAAVRNCTRPSFTPLSVAGNPPPKSKLMLALVRAPQISGPKASRPMIDCRSVPPTEPEETARIRWLGPGGYVLVVHRTAVAKEIEQNDARQPNPVLGSAFDFGLILVVDLSGEQLLVFLNVVQPLRQLGGGGTTVGRGLLIDSCVLGGAVPRFQFLAQTRDLGAAGNRLLLQLQTMSFSSWTWLCNSCSAAVSPWSAAESARRTTRQYRSKPDHEKQSAAVKESKTWLGSSFPLRRKSRAQQKSFMSHLSATKLPGPQKWRTKIFRR
jgi:hypothetical protein